MDAPGAAPPTDAETVAASVARLVHDLMEASSERVAAAVDRAVGRIGDMLGALLGDDAAPKPVKDLLEQVGVVVADIAQALVTQLTAGPGTPGPDDKLLERVGAVVGDLTRTLGDALGGALSTLPKDGHETSVPASNPVIQPLAFYGLPERATEQLFEQAGSAMAHLAQETRGALRNAGSAPLTEDRPFVPPVAPPPDAPSLPLPISPVGTAPASSSYLGASASSADALQLPFAILVLFSVALLQGGKLGCPRGDPLRPQSALQLAAERPG